MLQVRLSGSALTTSLMVIAIELGLIVAPVHAQQPEQTAYPAPRYPSLVQPETIEDIMPYARRAVRNENAFLGNGLGIIKPGEKVILVTMAAESSLDPAEDLYVEAVMRAYMDRGVKPILFHDYELGGLTLEELRLLKDYETKFNGPVNSKGWVNGCSSFTLNDFLEETRPDLYEKCNPDLRSQLPAHLKPVYDKMQKISLFASFMPDSVVINFLNDYMDDNPDVRGVFYGRGGPVWEVFQPKERWLGLFRFDNQWEVMSSARDFPADLWMASEEMTMEPLSAADKATITDPEGTDVWWDLTEEQAQRWATGVYLRGHLFMFPQEAYGGYGLNVLNYPANVPDYIPAAPIVKLNGTLAATASHFGYYPRIEEIWEDGYLREVRGEGTYPELLRTLMKMPGIHEKTWPHYDEPGYFWHYETALGTNPKVVRPDPRYYPIAPARERDGVMHWAFGAQVWHDPGSMETPAPSLLEFEEKYKLPAKYHTFHLRTHFNTMKVRIRGSNDRWVMLVDKGRSASLDSPEVRALASRYGDPDEVLATDWIPSIPGINAPGSYEMYAQDPYGYNVAHMNETMSVEN
jgi:hypothetical protein